MIWLTKRQIIKERMGDYLLTEERDHLAKESTLYMTKSQNNTLTNYRSAGGYSATNQFLSPHSNQTVDQFNQTYTMKESNNLSSLYQSFQLTKGIHI